MQTSSADELAARCQQLSARLDKVIHLNRQLVAAETEDQLIDTALAAFLDLADAEAVAYTPLDEHGRPLISYAKSNIPEPDVDSWQERLADKAVQQQCKTCRSLQAGESTVCPLLSGHFNSGFQIHCFPVRTALRLTGMVNIYLPSERILNEEMMPFLSGLIDELQAAMQLLRLSNQSSSTLKRLEQIRSRRADVDDFLAAALENLRQMLSMDGAYLRIVRTSNDQPLYELASGQVEWINPGMFNRVMRQAFSGKKFIEEDLIDCQNPAVLFGEPIPGQDGESLGVVCLARRTSSKLEPAQAAILHATARQISLIYEDSQDVIFGEYQTVMQERLRLAREIHDGLAQTLAYLKLQLFQMQSMAAKRDLEHLSQALDHNYGVINSAYLEVREVINNLRFNQRHEFTQWLAELISDFEKTTGMHVEHSGAEIRVDLAPEIQVQLIRIIQETFTNIRKHAHASRVDLSVMVCDGDLILEIKDDGQGFFPESVPDTVQFGLRGMRERAELIGADFQITSYPDRGTIVQVRLPASVLESFV